MDHLPLAAKLHRAMVRNMNRRAEEYERECAEYSRQGYRPEYCPHGTYLWTDYDPICGYCENGDPTPMELMSMALGAAKAATKRSNDRWRQAMSITDRTAPLVDALMHWATEPVTNVLKEYGANQ